MLRSLASEQPGPGPKTLVNMGYRVDDGDSVRLDLRTPDGRNVHVSLSRREFAQLMAGGVAQGLLPGGSQRP